jgi:tryptophanyl-tRNA synthetase
MSKSAENEKSRVAILEAPATFKKKIMSAVTDTDNEIRFDEDNKPGVSNLLSLYSLFTGTSIDATVAHFQGQGYGTLKKELVEVMTDKLGTIQARYQELSQDHAELDRILAASAERARTIAEQTVNRVKDAMGLVRL